MLYILGGAPRSGKSILSRKMVSVKQVPYFPLDALIGSLDAGAPELGISHNLPFIDKAEKAWRFSKHFLTFFAYAEESSFLVEGDCLLPKHIRHFQNEHSKVMIRSCFVGYVELNSEDKLTLVRKHQRGPTDWTNNQTDEQMLASIERMIVFSKFLKEECLKNDIPYFDISHNFEDVHQKIFAYLSEGTL